MDISWDAVTDAVKTTNKSMELIKGRKVLLMLGDSGAGKTATIFHLNGNGPEGVEMLLEDDWNENELRHIYPIPVRNTDIIAVDTHKLSETLDDPSEELAKLYSLSLTLQSSASLIPVLVIDYNDIIKKKTANFRRLFLHIGNLFKKNTQVLTESLLVLVSKSPKYASERVLETFLQEMLAEELDETEEFTIVAKAIITAVPVKFFRTPYSDFSTWLLRSILEREPIVNPGKTLRRITPTSIRIRMQGFYRIADLVRWIEIERTDKIALLFHLCQVLTTPSFTRFNNTAYQTVKSKQDEALQCFASFIRNPSSTSVEVPARKIKVIQDILSQFTQTTCQVKGLMSKEAIQYYVLRGLAALSLNDSESLIMSVAKNFTFCPANYFSRFQMVQKVKVLQLQVHGSLEWPLPSAMVWIEEEVERKGYGCLATTDQFDEGLKTMIRTVFQEEGFVGIDDKGSDFHGGMVS